MIDLQLRSTQVAKTRNTSLYGVYIRDTNSAGTKEHRLGKGPNDAIKHNLRTRHERDR
jgi:hypothetical protein